MNAVNEMDILREVLFGVLRQTPYIVTSLIFLIAVLFKLGKERGAGLILLGAILNLMLPFVTAIINPALMHPLYDQAAENGGRIELLINVSSTIINLFWAFPFILLAIGTALRPRPGKQQ